MNAGELRERVMLQRIQGDGDGAWVNAGEMSAAVEAQGDARYRVRIRYRDDLKSLRDCEPGARLRYRDQVLDIEDVVEFERRVEVHLFCRDIVVEDPRLATGGRRVKGWDG